MTEPSGAIFRERTTRWLIEAPREEVWRAWTEPEEIAAWWGPKGMHTPLDSIEMDVRPGGVFRLTMVADGSGAEFPTEMHFREVAAPDRLVYAWEAQRGLGSGAVTVTFAEHGEDTLVTIHFAGFATDEIFTGAKHGWKGQMAKLDARVGSGKHAGWTFEFNRGDDGDRFKTEEVMNADAQLLGRITYEGFAAAWPAMRDKFGEFSEHFNAMPHYVVSTTLADEDASWENSTVIRDDVAGAVRTLKQEVERDILVSGSATLVRTLAGEDLVDRYRLMVFPVVLGTGKRLFPDGFPHGELELAELKPVGPDGLFTAIYEPKR